MRPVASFHSRANGTRHGITSAVERGRRVLVAVQGRRCHPRYRPRCRRWPAWHPSSRCRRSPRPIAACRRCSDVDFDAAQGRDPRAAGRERRRQIDADQDHGRGRRGDQRARCSIAARRCSYASPFEALARRHRHGVPGDQPRALDDGGAEPLSRRREIPQPAARHLHRRPAVPAVAELPRRSRRPSSRRSARPSGRWWRSPAPSITRPRSSSSTSRPRR